ncbi:polyamine aminopropyltransferase [Dichotomopilus funicola]|uniref:Polyamine aminopropyltransferase n=1 Tax=Dichotomopilus funicola TaxID=1934379 RepID=A0AAN6UY68_9PEZI|nr:polyamine aminopropyltransferase [Dichotomopilus funicola]
MAPKSSSKKRTATPSASTAAQQKTFEADLRSLARKARSDSLASSPLTLLLTQTTLYLRVTGLLLLAALSTLISQLSLSPVYGSIPSSSWHTYLVAAACFTGWSGNLALERALRRGREGGSGAAATYLLPVLALWVPVVHFVLGGFSGVLTARWGPVVTEAVALFPLVAVSASCVATELEGVDLSGLPLPGWVVEGVPGLGAYGGFKVAAGGLVGRTWVHTRVGMQVVLGGVYAVLAPSRLLVLTVPALFHTAVLNTHAPTPAALGRLNAGLAEVGYVLLDRAESNTGYISVLDSPKEGFRLLRCDHSLLGGEWVKFLGQGRFKGNQVAEPVYGVFTMLEAVRLVETPEPIVDSEANALVIGLGIGTTPAALIAHGIDTTVVELDPVVHRFASQYFQLPSNHTAVIEDAVTYTSRTAADESEPRFDYIIHDVFTGGAEPIALFTLEFLQNLHALLKPNGVVAINYAGDFALPPPRIVVNTIRTVFPTCRIFREHPRDEDDFALNGRDFTNMVIFCTKTDTNTNSDTNSDTNSGTVKTITFREPTERDLLNSPSRQAFLLPRHEVTDADFLVEGPDAEGVLRRNETERLVKWHAASAAGHWTVMRTVLPEAVWEAW